MTPDSKVLAYYNDANAIILWDLRLIKRCARYQKTRHPFEPFVSVPIGVGRKL